MLQCTTRVSDGFATRVGRPKPISALFILFYRYSLVFKSHYIVNYLHYMNNYNICWIFNILTSFLAKTMMACGNV